MQTIRRMLEGYILSTMSIIEWIVHFFVLKFIPAINANLSIVQNLFNFKKEISCPNLQYLKATLECTSNQIILKFCQFRWNPFRKKSGIMGVIYAQSKRNRVVSKHGRLNTFVRPDEKEEQHR